MLKIGSADKTIQVAVERRVESMRHQAAAVISNAKKVVKAGKLLRKQHGGN